MSEPSTSPFALHGRVALVTGGARGIGLVAATTLAAAGAKVVVVDVEPGRLHHALHGLDPQSIAGWPCDITDEAAVVETVDRARRTFGVVDIVVNNAGAAKHQAPEELSNADFRRVIDVGLTGTFLVSRTAALALIEAGRPGAIVNLSSIAGSTSLGRGIFAYGVAKAGIDQMTRECAVEWASHGIRVNAVAPCQVRTEGFAAVADAQARAGDQLVDRVSRAIPLGRLAESQDVANAIWFLASDASAMITGAVLPVDGGNLAMNAGATLRPSRSPI